MNINNGGNTVDRGAAAEQVACRYLEDRGLRLVMRNYRCPPGEIDLIMTDGRYLVFVEVRSRRHYRFAHPFETVGPRKQRRIRLAAAHYLQAYRRTRWRCRFDVVAVTSGSGNKVQWVRNAFWSD